MPRKKVVTDAERVRLRASVRSNGRFDHYSQLYPSLPARVEQILATTDPALRKKIEVLGHAFLVQDADQSAAFARRFNLTPAQVKVALHVAAQGSVAEYAEKTGISEATVRTHLKAIFAKTGVSRQAELARLVLRG